MKNLKNTIANISEYYHRIADLATAGGTKKETSIRKAFLELIEKYAKEKQLTIVDEINQFGTRNIPDAGLQNSLGLNFGYIENKDIDDDIETEIVNKINKGYDLTNIIFENTQWLVLYQNKHRVCKVYIGESDLINHKISEAEFEKVIKQFIDFEPPFISQFKQALEKFKEQIPEISTILKKLIVAQYQSNQDFINKVAIFLQDCKDAISKEISFNDINNMIVQHILTKDIFDAIFNDQQFHKYNSIAKSIDAITSSFFTKEQEIELTKAIRSYYTIIIYTSKAIHDHRQKQSFLKTIYQEFYKAYNPAKADRQGIEYTPIEIVSFMIEMTDLLLFQHFNQNLQDKGSEILDPCTGTGIFISELLYKICHSANFEYKFNNEIFCNEIDILPYYIANLNIEYIRAQIKGNYKEFKNIVLVDTLNNVASLTNSKYDNRNDLFSEANRQAFNENNQKIKQQNDTKLKVIIGNPPYNANQQNENDNNKNFSYPHIDNRIKETYIAKSTAQKTKQFDMYKRFVRWASDRMDDQKGGIIAFITNNAYLSAKQDDGFRACVAEEFDYAYFVDLKGNSRLHGEEAKKQGENVFNIRVGCGIMFLVKNNDNLISASKHRCQIKYLAVDDYASKQDKLNLLSQMAVQIANNISLKTYNEVVNQQFSKIIPSKQYQWLGQVENDWQNLVPLISKGCKNNTIGADAIFKLYSLGVSTNRDKWVYDLNKKNLVKKVKKFIEIYNQELAKNKAEITRINKLKKSKEGKKDEGGGLTTYYLENKQWEYSLSGIIKLSATLKSFLKRKQKLKIDKYCIKEVLYRPFCKKYIYYSYAMNDRPALFNKIFPNQNIKERVICFDIRGVHRAIMADCLLDLHTNGDSLAIPLHIYEDGETKIPNLTDYGRKIFIDKYQQATDEQIFYYCYAVLNQQQYQEKYQQNLKVDLPRIPLLPNFHQLAELGKKLADLHINYEEAEKYQLELYEIPQKNIDEANKIALKRDFKPNIYLKASKEQGEIKLDDYHIFKGIPKQAFDYKIGNKSPLEWVCSGFLPPKYDLTEENEALLAELDEYNWQEVKENLLDLIPRLITVSLESQKILQQISTIA